MAYLTARLENAARSLAAFDESLDASPDQTRLRDAAILRFILAFEATLTAVRQYLKEVEFEERSSPGACIRASRANGLVGDTEAEALLAMAQDRNRAVHAYDEAMARALFERLPGHAQVLRRWLDAVFLRVHDA